MAERPSLVLQLQDLAQSDSTPIGELLRKAKTVAVKLGQPEVSGWLKHEVEGYGAGVEVPEYRRVTTELKWRNPHYGMMPVNFGAGAEDMAEHFASFLFRDSVHKAVEFARADPNTLKLSLHQSEFTALAQSDSMFARVETYRTVNGSDFSGIVAAVRDRILDWALDLERLGVMGWGMTFTKEEKAAGAGPSINVSNVISSPGAASAAASGNARVTQNISNTLPSEVASALEAMAGALRTSKELQENQLRDALEQLDFLKQQCETAVSQRAKPGIINSALTSLKLLADMSISVKAAWVTFGPVVTDFLQTGSAALGAG